MEFSNALELKERVMPALRLKEERLRIEGFNVSCEDIWFYLKQNKWPHASNLTLNEVVNDILKLDGNLLKKGSDNIG